MLKVFIRILLISIFSVTLISCDMIKKWFGFSAQEDSSVESDSSHEDNEPSSTEVLKENTGMSAQVEFLNQNKDKEGVKTTASGLQYKVIKEGVGKSPGAQSLVEVHYQGTLIDGTEFDSSYKRNETAKFPLNQVIPGWTEGVQLMKEGATYEFYIPSNLAYGDRDHPSIPAGSTLIFKVELIKVF